MLLHRSLQNIFIIDTSTLRNLPHHTIPHGIPKIAIQHFIVHQFLLPPFCHACHLGHPSTVVVRHPCDEGCGDLRAGDHEFDVVVEVGVETRGIAYRCAQDEDADFGGGWEFFLEGSSERDSFFECCHSKRRSTTMLHQMTRRQYRSMTVSIGLDNDDDLTLLLRCRRLDLAVIMSDGGEVDAMDGSILIWLDCLNVVGL
mmetsp:Transcript_5972/g.11580  ORF Transcript_5972/g.11580 Transcript_5972/m.11580 type:complete len:200 (+) Transcript_5972:2204-2803(+)